MSEFGISVSDFVRQMHSAGRCRLIATAVGGFLVSAALVKAFAPSDAARLQAAYDLPPSLVLTAICIEVAIGMLLISGFAIRFAWNAATCLFLAFAGFSLYRAVAGYESCGCFGSFRVNPWATFAIDIAFLSVLFLSRCKVACSRTSTWDRLSWVWPGCFIVIAGVAGATVVASSREHADGGHSVIASDGLTILEPKKWIGREFPLAPYLTPTLDSLQGTWIALIYHHDCPTCQEVLPKYEALAANGAELGHIPRILLIETPPYSKAPPTRESYAESVRLLNDRDWFVQTPVELVIADGKVLGASVDLPAVRELP